MWSLSRGYANFRVRIPALTFRVCGLISPQRCWCMSSQSGKWGVRDWGDSADDMIKPHRVAATTIALVFEVMLLLNHSGLLADDFAAMDGAHRSYGH